VEDGIGGAPFEGGLLDILAYDARALLVATAEEIGAGVMVRVSVSMPVGMLVSLVVMF